MVVVLSLSKLDYAKQFLLPSQHHLLDATTIAFCFFQIKIYNPFICTKLTTIDTSLVEMQQKTWTLQSKFLNIIHISYNREVSTINTKR